MKHFLIFCLLAFALGAQAQVSEPTGIRLFWVSTQIVKTDADGTNAASYPYTSVNVSAYITLIRVQIAGTGTLYYSPSKFLNDQGTPYGVTVNEAMNAYLGSIPASAGGGSGSANDLTSGVIPVGRYGSTVVQTTGSYSNPPWLLSLSAAKILGQIPVSQLGTGTPATGKYLDGGSGAWTTLPAGGGSATTDASQLTTGTLPDGRLSGNVILASGSYPNPNFISALDPSRVSWSISATTVSGTEKASWNGKLDANTYNTNRTTDQTATTNAQNTANTALSTANSATTTVGTKENALGNPTTNGYILSSTSTGTRSWIAPPSGGGGTVDNSLNIASANAISNGAVTTALNAKADASSQVPRSIAYNATLAIPYVAAQPNVAVTLTGNATISITGSTNGDGGLLKITKTTGSETITFSNSASGWNPRGVPCTTAGCVDLYSWINDAGVFRYDAGSGPDLSSAIAAKAPLASPAFTGTPTAPTAATTATGNQVATLDFVKGVVATVPTGSGGSVYTVTTLTRNAIQAAIDAAGPNSTINLSPTPGTSAYTGFDVASLTISGKTNLTIQGFGAANFTASTATFILDQGNNTNLKILGINFRNTATTGGGNGQININEQGPHTGLVIANSTFKAPRFRQNAITSAVYSATADGGSGVGNVLREVEFTGNVIDSMGRCGIELVGHTWNDGLTTTLLFNINIHHNTIKHTGLVAESNGTTYNGMAVSISGYAVGLNVNYNYIDDAKLLGIEYAGTRKSSITGNIITNPSSVSFTGISISDNNHNATYDLIVSENNVTTRAKPISVNQARNVRLTGNIFTQTDQNTTGGAVYFQNSTDISLTGGSINAFCFNPIRLDDASKVIIGGGLSIDNQDANDYASISMYGTGGLTPGYNTISADILYKKRGVVVTSGLTEQIGTQANNTIFLPKPAIVDGVLSATSTNAVSNSAVTTAIANLPVTQVVSFTTAGTYSYTLPAGAKTVRVILIGAGGGGGSGRKGASGEVRSGGGGGQAGGRSDALFDATTLPATVTLVVGAKGTGGVSTTANSTNGTNGTNGGASTFHTFLKANGGANGAAGNTSTASGGGGTNGLTYTGGNGASSSSGGTTGNPGTASSTFGSAGGASGGGVDVSNVAWAGAIGGGSPSFANITLTGGVAGTISGNGSNGISGTDWATGGGSGGGSTTANGGDGGLGGYPAGGGAGGGAAVNGVGNSGKGGDAADGKIVLIIGF